MKTLHLTLKKQWFDMILSGEKKEEYREIKDYWLNRLYEYEWLSRNNSYAIKNYTEPKFFDTITFKNGYSSEAPEIIIECKGITEGQGNPEWGGSNQTVFIIKLGNILSTKNIPQ